MNDITERIARMIENDANRTLKRTMSVLQSDVCVLLGEFMDVTKMDMSISDSQTGYDIVITVHASRIHSVGNTTEDNGR